MALEKLTGLERFLFENNPPFVRMDNILKAHPDIIPAHLGLTPEGLRI
ncbi:MAG: hypothetical protein LBS61_02335 [Endomicrobium sp.]|jgi:hypothetical protein|nr:hypothetical protein [Endomicrobium sp.]